MTVTDPHPWTVTVRVGASLVIYRQCTTVETALRRAHDCLRLGTPVQATLLTHDLPWLSDADLRQMPDSPWGRIAHRVQAPPETTKARLVRQGLRHLMAKGEWQVTQHQTEKDDCMAFDIGDISFTPEGDRLRITIAEAQDTTTWTVAGAAMAAGYLLAWIRQQQGIDAVARMLQHTEVLEEEH